MLSQSISPSAPVQTKQNAPPLLDRSVCTLPACEPAVVQHATDIDIRRCITGSADRNDVW